MSIDPEIRTDNQALGAMVDLHGAGEDLSVRPDALAVSGDCGSRTTSQLISDQFEITIEQRHIDRAVERYFIEPTAHACQDCIVAQAVLELFPAARVVVDFTTRWVGGTQFFCVNRSAMGDYTQLSRPYWHTAKPGATLHFRRIGRRRAA